MMTLFNWTISSICVDRYLSLEIALLETSCFLSFAGELIVAIRIIGRGFCLFTVKKKGKRNRYLICIHLTFLKESLRILHQLAADHLFYLAGLLSLKRWTTGGLSHCLLGSIRSATWQDRSGCCRQDATLLACRWCWVWSSVFLNGRQSRMLSAALSGLIRSPLQQVS